MYVFFFFFFILWQYVWQWQLTDLTDLLIFLTERGTLRLLRLNYAMPFNPRHNNSIAIPTRRRSRPSSGSWDSASRGGSTMLRTKRGARLELERTTRRSRWSARREARARARFSSSSPRFLGLDARRRLESVVAPLSEDRRLR